MRQLAALVDILVSGRGVASGTAMARVVLVALAALLVTALAWMHEGEAASPPVAETARSPVTLPGRSPSARMPAVDPRPVTAARAQPVAPAPVPRSPPARDGHALAAAFEHAPDLYALSRDLAPAVLAGDGDALWVNSRIHDYCAGYAASPAGYARNTDLLAQLGGGAGVALRAARERVAQRCGRFAPIDALTMAGVIRQREDAALAGHLAAEASLLAVEAPLDESPEYLRDLVERVQQSGDAEAFAALSPGMGVAASGRSAFAGLVAGTPLAELAWQVAACRRGLDCGPGSTLMTQYCASGGICPTQATQDFETFVHDAAIPRQGAEKLDDMVDTLLRGVQPQRVSWRWEQ